jgi:uncharacterized protein
LAKSVIADSGFLAALIRAGDTENRWATAAAAEYVRPWITCEAALTEAFFLLGSIRRSELSAFLLRGALQIPFHFATNHTQVLALMEKYASVPMSFADACLVRMTEVLPDPVVLTTDSDFRAYRRLGRQVVPCVMPKA